MASSRFVRLFALFLLFAVSSIATAATTEFRVFLDNDPNAGCTVAGMDGVDRVLVTQINDSSTPARVTRVFRQDCMGVALGSPTDLSGTPWDASFNTTNRTLTFETRIPFMAFGTNDMPAGVIAGFQLTRLSASHTVLLQADGSLMIVPEAPSRRRAIDFEGSRHITPDGVLTDWVGIDPLTFGAAGSGSQSLRLLRVLAFADANEKNLYFAGVAYVDSNYPVADDDLFLRDPDQGLSVGAPGVLENDSDPQHQTLHAQKVSDPKRGSIILNDDGSFTYSPNHPQVHASDEFEYKVTAGGRESNTARVRISVDTGESPKTPNDDAYETARNTPLTVPAPGVLDNDPDKLVKTTLATPPSHGTVNLHEDGGFTYTPATDFVGIDTFVYTATKKNGNKAGNVGADAFGGNATVTITVTAVVTAPTANDDNYSVAEDGTLTVPQATGALANDTDPQGDALTGTPVLGSGPAHGVLTWSPFLNGAFTYQPDANYFGPDQFSYTASDGAETSNVAVVHINVTAVNDPPSFTGGGDVSTNEDTAFSAVWATAINKGAPNESAQVLTFTVTPANPALFSVQPAINPSTGVLTFTPAANANGTTSVTATLTDNGGGSNSSAPVVFNITIDPVNDAPSFVKGPDQVADEDQLPTAINPWATSISPGPADEAGQSVTFTVTGNTNPGLFSAGPAITPGGVLSYTVAANASGTAQITITLSDNGVPVATSAPQTFNITVNGVNDAPVNTVPAAQNTNEDTPLTFTVGGGNGIQIADIDAGAGSLQVTLAATNGTLTADTGAAIANNNTANVTLTGTVANINASLDGLIFNPTPNFNGLAQLTITTDDQGNTGSGGAQQDIDTVDITVLAVNDQPVVNAATFSLPENSANATVVGTVTFTDPDVGQTQTFAITAGNTGGAFAINASTGAITVANSAALDFEANPTFSLTVTVQDNSGAGNDTGSNTITVNLTDVNEAPTANDATFAVDENSPNGTVVGTVSATDPDNTAPNSTLTYAITAGNTGGAFAINASTGQITVANPINFETLASYSLTVTVTDGGAGPLSDTATITINVNDLNEAPTANDATFAIDENVPNGTVVGTVVATDPDTTAPNNTLTYAITAGNTGGAFAINSSNGQITVANPIDFEALSSYSLTVTVTDGGAGPLSDTATITVNINDLNEAPVVNDQTFAVDENVPNGTVVGTVVATDQDTTAPNNTLTYAITAGNTGGAFAINASNGQITVANPIDFETLSSYALTVTVTDAGAGTLSDTATVTININNVNEAPVVIAGGPFSLAENSANGTAVFTAAATDPDTGQTLTWSITGGNTGGAFAINASSGQVTVANAAAVNFETTPSFTLTVQATDNGVPNLSDSENFVINLTDVNDAPVVSAATFSLPENSPNGTSVGSATATDEDLPAQTLSYAITGGNTGGAFAINSATGEITVANVAAVDFETTPTFSLTVTVTDNGVPPANGSNTITINLTDANEPPVVNDQSFAVDENVPIGTVVGSIAFSDPDGPSDTFAITAGNVGGEFAVNASTGQITTAAALNFESTSSYVFTITISDAGTPLGTDTADITININNVNEAPVVDPAGPFNIDENSANGTNVGSPITFSDPDTGQTHTYAITGGNTGGAFAISGTGQITVANAAAVDFEVNPTFSLTVQVTDVGAPLPNLSGTTTVTVNVNNLNEAPVVNDQPFSVAENSPNGTVVGTVVATDPDATAPNNTLTYAITAGNTGGAFAINASNGQITVANPINFETLSSYSLTVTVTDGGAGPLSDTATVTITVLDVNEAPVANDATFGVDENVAIGTVVGTVVATDPDSTPPNNTLTYAITAGNTGGAFAINSATGQITTATAIDFETLASYSLTVTVTDGGAGPLSDPATITINVTNLNEAPVVNPAGPFSLDENSPNATLVGTPITFTEPDTTGQTHTYAITAGNTGGAFAIDSSGQISVATSAAVNFETTPTFTLTVTVTDAGAPGPPLSGSTSVTINLNNVNDAPVYSDAARSIAENSSNGTNVGAPVTASDEDAGQTLTYSITGGNTGGAFAINSSTGQITVANTINFEVTSSYSLTVQATDNGAPVQSDTATVTITVTDVNEAPTANDATFAVNENVPNGTVVGTVVATDPDTTAPNNTLTYAITAGNTGGAFAINSSSGQITVANLINYEALSAYSLTVTVTDGGAGPLNDTATITINVTDLNEAPTATTDTYTGLGNTTLHIAGGVIVPATTVTKTGDVDNSAGHPRATGLKANDTDPDTNPAFNTLTITFVTGNAGAVAVPGGGSATTTTTNGTVTLHSDGSFLYTHNSTPATILNADSFTYTINDGLNNVTGTVNINMTGPVIWYVKNDVGVAGAGTSASPYQALASAITNSAAGSIVYVMRGDGTATNLGGSNLMKDNQKLWGQGVDLDVTATNGVALPDLITATSNALIGPGAGVNETVKLMNVSGVDVQGLTINGGTTNAIDLTTSGGNGGGFSISNSTISAATLEGIDINAVGNGVHTVTVGPAVTITSTGNGIDEQATGTGAKTVSVTSTTINSSGVGFNLNRTAGTMGIVFSNNSVTASGAGTNGVTIAGGAAASTTITGFLNNTISGNTTGVGIAVSNATFDTVAGTPFVAVTGGTTVVGASGATNGAGTGGMSLTNVLGDLTFTDLDLYADTGTALTVTSSGVFNAATGTGMRFVVSNSGVATAAAASGKAVDLQNVTTTLQLGALTSTNSGTQGVNLSSVAGTFSAAAGSTISGSTGTGYLITGSSVNATYNGTINVASGAGVSLTTNTGTYAFTGQLTLSTGASPAFVATSSGTVSSSNAASTLATTTATALNVTNTTIAAAGLKFTTIAAGTAASGPVNGIILNNTGASGSLTVSGGGTIQKTTGDGISLTNTLSPSFNLMNIQNTTGSGIKGTTVTNFTLTNSTINNSNSANPEDANVNFNTSTLGTETNLSGAVTITGNTLTNSFGHGVNILNYNGTISDANISSNTITSSTAIASSKGSGIRLQILGSASGAAVLTKAEIQNNIVTNFPSGGGIVVQGGNTNASGPGGTMGTPGSGTNIISITSNRVAGASAANPMGASGIIAILSGANSGSRSQANFDVSFNGTVANPVANMAGTAILVAANGYATGTWVTNSNTIVANNTVASNGIGGGVGIVTSSAETGDMTWTINSNNISQTDGNGILAVARGTSGFLKVKIQSNTVAAPLTGNREGIRIDAGNATSIDDGVCLNITGNTSAGSGVALGIGLRKNGSVTTVNDFGINGMAATTSPGIETYVNGLNPAGGGAEIISGSNFNNCSNP